MDEEEDEEESALAFVDPSAHVAATLESTAAAAPKKRKRGKAANVPLDADGLPMEWDESTGAWVEAVGCTAGPQGLSEQWVQKADNTQWLFLKLQDLWPAHLAKQAMGL